MVKLLIIDDDLSLCDFFKNFFSKRDYQVFIATDGEKGLSIVRDERPNIILLDMIIMPGQFGLDILQEIKKIDDKAKVIMLTGVGDKGVIELAKMYGASDYITKPFDLEQLEKDVMPKIIRQLL
ncbi:MAG: response regulator [Candidatus Omnitrophica bacterium]|nr:response regulator [Candidatus Omnitrophota bacterium]